MKESVTAKHLNISGIGLWIKENTGYCKVSIKQVQSVEPIPSGDEPLLDLLVGECVKSDGLIFLHLFLICGIKCGNMC